MFVKNGSAYAAVEARMRNFREKTRKYWQYQDGSERQTCATRPSRGKSSATSPTEFRHLQLVKAQLDPHDMFSNMGTIPLPSN